MPLHWHAWQMVTQRHDLHFPEDRFYSLGGVPSRDILKMLAQEQRRSLDHIAVAHEKEDAYLPLMAQVEPIHAVVEIAKANSRENSDGRRVRRHAENHRQVLDHLEYPASVRRGRDERNGEEPEAAPDIFLEAARRIGVAPKFCRAYEDTDLGLKAIRAAGMEAVDVRKLLSRTR